MTTLTPIYALPGVVFYAQQDALRESNLRAYDYINARLDIQIQYSLCQNVYLFKNSKESKKIPFKDVGSHGVHFDTEYTIYDGVKVPKTITVL